MEMEKIGSYSFIAGVVLSILIGFVALSVAKTVLLVLVVLGLIVGFLNITEKESTPFLVAAIALMAAGSAQLSLIPRVGEPLSKIIGAITIFVAPAAIIVALKAIKDMAKTK